VISRSEVLLRPGAVEQDRLPVWRDTLQGVQDFKSVGIGLGTYQSSFGPRQRGKLDNGASTHTVTTWNSPGESGVPAALVLFGSLSAPAACARRAVFVLSRQECAPSVSVD